MSEDTLRERLHYWFERHRYLKHWNTEKYQIILMLKMPFISGPYPKWNRPDEGKNWVIFDWAFCLGFIEVRKWHKRVGKTDVLHWT